MKEVMARWTPAALLAFGIVFTIGLPTQRRLALRAPLDESVPTEIAGYHGFDLPLAEDELRATGVTEYVLRSYEASDSTQWPAWFSVYVGYYDSQRQGKTIHTPKNCMPGSGWEPLSSERVRIPTEIGLVKVNRYVLQGNRARALVLYWYQGRGRVEANEYTVKWELLRDAALRKRTDEALVRVVVPIVETEERAFELAIQTARVLVPRLDAALPAAG